MSKPKSKWKLVEHFPITEYECGACAGDRVCLKLELVIRDGHGQPTGKVYPRGDIWTVVRGAKENPRVLWLRASDDTSHTWEDSDLFWIWFEKTRKRAGKTRV